MAITTNPITSVLEPVRPAEGRLHLSVASRPSYWSVSSWRGSLHCIVASHRLLRPARTPSRRVFRVEGTCSGPPRSPLVYSTEATSICGANCRNGAMNRQDGRKKTRQEFYNVVKCYIFGAEYLTFGTYLSRRKGKRKWCAPTPHCYAACVLSGHP